MKPTFRTAMLGFHKDDVFQFVTKQNKQFESKIQELGAERASLEKEWEKEREALEGKCRELEDLSRDGESASKTLLSVKDRLIALQSDLSALRVCYEKCDGAIRESRDQFNHMKEKAEEASLLRDKAEKFDRLSGVLASILGAQSSAEAEPKDKPVTVSDPAEDMVDFRAFSDLSRLLDGLETHVNEILGDIPEAK